MNPYKKNALWAGILFLIGTLAGFATLPFWGSLSAQDYLTRMAAEQTQVLIGCLLVTIMGMACAGIAVALYPILKKAGRGMTLGSVGFRLMEGTLQVVGVGIVVALLAASQDYIGAAGTDSTALRAIGGVIMTAYHWTGNVSALLAWCVGALLYYILFYRSKLVPRWLSVWGIVGILMAAAVAFMTMFRQIDSSSALSFILHGPIMVQELVLAVWLITKGFAPSALTALENKTAPTVSAR